MAINNLSLVGCGVRGIAHAGAISVLEDKGITDGIDNVAGTSAGSIVGALFSMRYTSKEIKSIMNDTDFKSFEDGNILNVAQDVLQYGLHPGDVFLRWLEAHIQAKTGNPLSTFAEFKAKGFRNLVVFATNLNTQSVRQFDWTLTPNIPVAYSIRASMSIPIFFRSFKIEGDLYVDGGTVINYPIDVFDLNGVNYNTLGIHFNDLGQPQPNNGLDFGHLIKYIKVLADVALNSQNINLSKNKPDLSRSVIVDSLGISATNFGLTDEQKESLWNAGVSAMDKHLK